MDAFETFYRDNLRLVYAAAIAREADSANIEDLAQETFFRAWRHFSRLAALAPQAQRAWLVRTVQNLAIDYWRQARHAVLAERAGADPSPPLEERIALRLDVARALRPLAETDRQIVVFRYCLGMNSREIGEILEMPEGSVRFRLQQSRKVLMERLEAWDPEKRDAR